MIKIQRDPTLARQMTTGAPVTKSATEARSRDTYVGHNPHGFKLLGTAMFALAAIGGASARDLAAPWQGHTGLRPMLRQSAGGAQGHEALSANPTSYRGLRSIFASAPVTAAPAPIASAPISGPVPGPMPAPSHAAQNDATPSNWLSPITAPHAAEAPAFEG